MHSKTLHWFLWLFLSNSLPRFGQFIVLRIVDRMWGSLWCRNEEFDEDLMKWWLIQCLNLGKRLTASFTCCLFHSLFLFTLSSISLFSLTHTHTLFLFFPLSVFLLWDFSSSFRSSLARCIIALSGFSWVPQGIFLCMNTAQGGFQECGWHTCGTEVSLSVFIWEWRQKHMWTHIHDMPSSQAKREAVQGFVTL